LILHELQCSWKQIVLRDLYSWRTPALAEGQPNPVVLKVVDIDRHGSIAPSKRSINSHGVEWGSLNGKGVDE